VLLVLLVPSWVALACLCTALVLSVLYAGFPLAFECWMVYYWVVDFSFAGSVLVSFAGCAVALLLLGILVV
jgi:hypothetical protein